jgi:FKBP-type peptidyl-prolyl cis-trans isomerase
MQMLKKYTLYCFALLGMMVLFSACEKDYESIESVDEAKIQAYISQNNLAFTKDPSGYYYKIVEPGVGDAIKNSDSIYYSYAFKSLSGTVYNQSSDLFIPGTFLGYTDRFLINGVPYTFTAIREVLAKLKRGGKANVILPSNMAFGKNGLIIGNLPSNEIIMMDLSVYPQSKKHEINDLEINSFIKKNNLTLTKDPSRAYYSVITPGTGTVPITASSTIKANYTARNLDGTIIDSSSGGVFVNALSGLYKGWRLNLPGRLTAGGKIRLILPADLADGQLIYDFDIEIVEVTN